MSSLSNISNWMENKTLFITGATGFLGKVLIEKLLRDCSNLNQIYILIRVKNNTSVAKRLEEYKNNEIFNLIRTKNSNLLNKLQAVSGDLVNLNEVLSESDKVMLINQVDIVIHAAATVRFDESLTYALKLNTKGTLELLEFSKSIKHLQSFIYVSTAYSNTDVSFIQETIYKPLIDYKYVLDVLERGDNDALMRIEDKILKVFPNTYIFSKNLAECIVFDSQDKIPVAIIRPSIVCPSYKEPFPGWVDSLNGPVSVLIGATTGILRTVHGSGSIIPDLVPVDFVANATIAAAVQLGKTHEDRTDCRIYNCTTSTDLPITLNEFLQLGKELFDDYPSSKVLWYPGGQINSIYIIHVFYFIITQFIPAVFYDFYRIVTKRKPWLFKLQKRIFHLLNKIDYFLNREWKWENSNFRLLYSSMVPVDQHLFNFDITKIDYKDYIVKWIVGSRRFILKQDESTIPAAKRKLKIFYWLHLVLHLISYISCLYFFLKIFIYLDNWLHLSNGILYSGECTRCSNFKFKY